MDTQRNTAVADQSQEERSEALPLDLLIGDLRHLRETSLARERKRRSGVLAGQLLILARSYQSGRRPTRRTLRRFFFFVAKEQAGPMGEVA
jgi:hypothetical protein